MGFRRNGVKDDDAVTRKTWCDLEFFRLAYFLKKFINLLFICKKLGKCCCGAAGGGKV